MSTINMADVVASVEAMDPETIKALAAKLLIAKAKSSAAAKVAKAKMTPEQKARAEEVKKAHNAKPEVKAKRQAYQKLKNAEERAILQKAKALGITAATEVVSTETVTA